MIFVPFVAQKIDQIVQLWDRIDRPDRLKSALCRYSVLTHSGIVTYDVIFNLIETCHALALR